MNRKKMRELLAERRALNADREKLNAKIKAASDGRPHHQGCPLGGLHQGMGCDVSGDPCWCGASAEPAPTKYALLLDEYRVAFILESDEGITDEDAERALEAATATMAFGRSQMVADIGDLPGVQVIVARVRRT